jgi:hypothetical protein
MSKQWSSTQNRTHREEFVRVVSAGTWKFTADALAQHTGAVAVEFERRSNGQVKPSGIATAKESHWVVEFDGRWVVLPVDEARVLVKRAQDEERTTWAGDGGASHIAKLPVAWLLGLETEGVKQTTQLQLLDHRAGRAHDKEAGA